MHQGYGASMTQQTSATAILMVDTGAPSLALSDTPPHAQYQGLTSWLNRRYAHEHGYTFLYYQLSERYGCRHPRWGVRHPSYCKLAAVALALKSYSTVAVVDSDEWFAPGAPPLSVLLRDNAQSKETARSSSSAAAVALVSFASDAPFSSGPNCGFMIWQSAAATFDLLRLWWHLDAGAYASQHDYEQRTLYWVLAHLDGYRGNSEVLQTLHALRPMLPNASLNGSPVVHVDHTRRGERLWRLSLAILGTDKRVARRVLAPRQDEVAAAERLLQRHRDSPEAQAIGRALLSAAWEVMTKPTMPERARARATSARRPSWRQRKRRRHRRKSAADLIDAGQEPRGPIIPTIVNVSAATAHLLHPVAQTDLGLPGGLALVLRQCAANYDRWQLWRTASASSLTSAPGLRLAAHSDVCMRSGPSVPLRPPHNVSLAQISPCNSSTEVNLVNEGSGDAQQIWTRSIPPSNQMDVHPSLLSTAVHASLVTPSLAPALEGTPSAADVAFATSLKMRLEKFVTTKFGHNGRVREVNETENGLHRHPLMATADAPFSAVNMVQDATKFAGKHGAWRRSHADMSRLFAKCTAGHVGGRPPDKPFQDCESWCRPALRRLHCGKCKCRACRDCSDKPEHADEQFAAADKHAPPDGLCLSVFRDDPLDGAPLVFTPCLAPPSTFPREAGSWQRQRQQRWRLASRLHGGETESRGYHLRSVSTPHLCVTAHPIFDQFS